MIRCVEVRLTIPDNEARTALGTLRRLGIPLGGLERSDVYRFEVTAGASDALERALRNFEPIYNPNKHVLSVREDNEPGAGEVWVDEIGMPGAGASEGTVRIGGRTLEGVRAYERFTAWRLLEPDGAPVSAAVVAEASRALLCNPAFQKATHS